MLISKLVVNLHWLVNASGRFGLTSLYQAWVWIGSLVSVVNWLVGEIK